MFEIAIAQLSCLPCAIRLIRFPHGRFSVYRLGASTLKDLRGSGNDGKG
jgi:hypothetical protein